MYLLTHSSSHIVVVVDVRSKEFKISRFVFLVLALSFRLCLTVTVTVSLTVSLSHCLTVSLSHCLCLCHCLCHCLYRAFCGLAGRQRVKQYVGAGETTESAWTVSMLYRGAERESTVRKRESTVK